jgi:hypothetical protein
MPQPALDSEDFLHGNLAHIHRARRSALTRGIVDVVVVAGSLLDPTVREMCCKHPAIGRKKTEQHIAECAAQGVSPSVFPIFERAQVRQMLPKAPLGQPAPAGSFYCVLMLEDRVDLRLLPDNDDG